VINHDVKHYYSYLPAFFYEKDLSLSFLNHKTESTLYARYYAPNKTPTGNPVIKMTMGMALGYLPFFCMAHVCSTLFDADASGFSESYHFAVQFSSLFYFLLALWFLAKILGYYFSDRVTALTLFILCFGTNVFYYLTIRAGNVHTFDFFLASLFLFYTLQWHRDQSLKQAAALGLTLGLLTLTRPVNFLFILVFLLHDVRLFSGLFSRFKLLVQHKLQLITAIFCFVLVIFPQSMYWHFVSGQYVFNSYVGEHFFFDRPHLIEGLVGFRKGWLIYTPVMLFALAGLFTMHPKLKAFSHSIPLFMIIYIYITFSWWCWWYGGSFGQRALIDVFPLLALPLALILEKISALTQVYRNINYTVIGFFVLLNLFQTMQAKYNILHYDSMTRSAYFHNFFRTSGAPDREMYLKHPDYEKALKGEDDY